MPGGARFFSINSMLVSGSVFGWTTPRENVGFSWGGFFSDEKHDAERIPLSRLKIRIFALDAWKMIPIPLKCSLLVDMSVFVGGGIFVENRISCLKHQSQLMSAVLASTSCSPKQRKNCFQMCHVLPEGVWWGVTRSSSGNVCCCISGMIPTTQLYRDYFISQYIRTPWMNMEPENDGLVQMMFLFQLGDF